MLHEEITDRIVKQLEAGTAPWVKPWAVPLPYNAATSRRYNGVNVLLLWDTPYPRPAWLTFQQATALGGRVRKGEHATRIVYVSTYLKEKEGKESERIPFLARYFVFNVEQVEGLPEHLYAPPERVRSDIDAFLLATKAPVRHGGVQAYYREKDDYIQLPHREHFGSADRYYATRLHETVHWTGHPSRLNREFGKRFGDKAYAFEELVAELGSAFLSADLGLSPELHHAEYLRSWVAILSGDKRAIFAAAARATYAAAYLKTLVTPDRVPEEAAL